MKRKDVVWGNDKNKYIRDILKPMTLPKRKAKITQTAEQQRVPYLWICLVFYWWKKKKKEKCWEPAVFAFSLNQFQHLLFLCLLFVVVVAVVCFFSFFFCIHFANFTLTVKSRCSSLMEYFFIFSIFIQLLVPYWITLKIYTHSATLFV